MYLFCPLSCLMYCTFNGSALVLSVSPCSVWPCAAGNSLRHSLEMQSPTDAVITRIIILLLQPSEHQCLFYSTADNNSESIGTMLEMALLMLSDMIQLIFPSPLFLVLHNIPQLRNIECVVL